MNQGGFALQIPRPELSYALLPVRQVKIHADRGVKIGGLWYGRADPALKPYEGKRPARGGQRKGEWVIRSDRRDRRQVFFQDPADPARWHALRWNGLPPGGGIPAFSGKTAGELLDQARAAGPSPQSDDDLLPVLLKLPGGVAPVSQWPSRRGKKEKKGPGSRDRPGRPGCLGQARQGARRRRRRGDGGSAPLAGAGVPGPRRDRRRAPPPPRAGRPAAARPARDARRHAARHQPAGASR